MERKIRIDKILLEKGFAKSREEAQDLIIEEKVFVEGNKVNKCSTLVSENSKIELKRNGSSYVSRGGIKLEHVIKNFNISIEGKIAIDIGASTGGFTDCLLRYGADKVYAVDVGYGQLDWKLRNNPKVVVIERTNIRYVDLNLFLPKPDIASIDVSFISLKLVLPVAYNILNPKGEIIALVKPQFEVGKGEVGKGGVVREKEKHNKVLLELSNFSSQLGLKVIGSIESPIQGAKKGNKEFFLYMKKDL